MGCGCPRPPSAALPPQGYSPLAAAVSSRRGARPGPALAVLPLPRRSAPFWRPWVPAPGEVGRRTGPGPAAVSGARRWGTPAAGIAVVTSGEARRGGGGGCSGWGPPRAGCRAGGLISALSFPASQPLRAGGSLPKAGAVHAPRQVSGSPGLPPVPAGELRAPGPLAAGVRGAAGPGGKSPLLGSVVPGWPSTGSLTPFDPTHIFM